MHARSSLLTLLLLALAGAPAAAASATPPPGAPWRTDLVAAQREALAASKPLLCYFTKTY